MDDYPLPRAQLSREGHTESTNTAWKSAALPSSLLGHTHPLDQATLISALASAAPCRLFIRLWHQADWQLSQLTLIPLVNSVTVDVALLDLNAFQIYSHSHSIEPEFSEIMGSVVHSFNNYLSAIMGFSELAIMDLPVEHAVYGQLETVLESGQGAVQFTRQLLAVAGRCPIIKVATDWSIYIQNQLSAADVSFQPMHETHQVLLDNTHLNMAIQQQIQFFKKQSKNPISAHLDFVEFFASDKKESFASVLIKQEGEGFIAEHAMRLLLPYYLSKITSEKRGLGLGPSLGIIRQHGGSLYAISEPGHGTALLSLIPLPSESENNSMEQDGVMPTPEVWVINHLPAITHLLSLQLRQKFVPMSILEAQQLLAQGKAPRAIVSPYISDIKSLASLRAKNAFTLVVNSPFIHRIKTAESGVVLVNFEASGLALNRALSSII